VVVVGMNLTFQTLGVHDPIAVVVAHPLTLEFVAGAAAGILVRWKTLTLPGPALVAGFVLLPAVLALPDMLTAFIADRGWMRVLVISVPCALVVYGAAAIERRGLPLVPDGLVALGDASYSIYLAHVLVLSALGRLFAMMPDHNAVKEVGFIIICIVGVNVIGVISSRLIERRHAEARTRSKPWLSARS
jgi:exopolysaccharide production protein ExoZ